MDAPKKKRGRPVGWRKHKPAESTPQLDLNQLDLKETEVIEKVSVKSSSNTKKLDIVKCPGDGCPRKESCLRFVQEPAPKNQCYFTMEVNIKNVNSCQFYWEV